MMSLVTCPNCKKEVRYPIGAVAAEICIRKTGVHCRECHQSSDKREWLTFCGPGCLVEFVNSEKWKIALDKLVAVSCGDDPQKTVTPDNIPYR